MDPPYHARAREAESPTGSNTATNADMDLSELTVGRTRETRIRRDAVGRWWNGDDRIEHPKLVRALDGWIERAEDGRLCLSNSINWAYATIEGPPYFVRSVAFDGDEVTLTLSGDRREPLDPTSLRIGTDDALYCDVLGGTLAARFDNHAAMALAARLDDDGAFHLGGMRIVPPLAADPLAPCTSRAPAVEPAP